MLELRNSNNSKSFRAEPDCYLSEKCRFLRNYVAKIENRWVVKKADCRYWVAAPLAVRGQPPATYRLTVDYLPINTAPIKHTWPMQRINAVLYDMQDTQAFADIDFTFGY